MKYFKKICVHDKANVALNVEKEKFKTSILRSNRDLIGSVCVHCHDNEALNSFGILKKFHYRWWWICKNEISRDDETQENANIRVLVDDEDQFLDSARGNTLPVGRFYSHLSGISIQKKIRRRQACYCINVKKYIMKKEIINATAKTHYKKRQKEKRKTVFLH